MASFEVIWMVPVVLLMLLACVQTAVWYHAANVAQAAAASGAAAGAPRSAGQGPAYDHAIAIARGSTAGDVAVSVASGSQQITVTVEIDVPRILPGFSQSVTRSFTEPRERFIPESERP